MILRIRRAGGDLSKGKEVAQIDTQALIVYVNDIFAAFPYLGLVGIALDSLLHDEISDLPIGVQVR